LHHRNTASTTHSGIRIAGAQVNEINVNEKVIAVMREEEKQQEK
jgi:hypothetical protein